MDRNQKETDMWHLGVALLLASAAPADPEYFRLDLAPSGSQISIGQPVVKGGMIVFHAYPDGKLMSLRKTDIKATTRVTAKEAAARTATNPKPIANLAMQGGTATVVGASGQPAGAGAAGSSGPALTRPIAQGMAAAQAASTASVPHTPD
jgi:hypothetical protein